MAVIVKVKDPKALIESINKGIIKGEIRTWSIDDDGDYTHTSEQWRSRAWFHPNIEDQQIVFSIICRIDVAIKVVEYGAYHGSLVEMLLNHFDHVCESILVTPMPHELDRIIPTNPLDKAIQ